MSRVSPRDAVRRIAGTALPAVTIAALLLAPGRLAAQGSAPAGFLEELQGQFDASASKLVALARAMPAESYGWSPGEGVYTVARVYTHVATYNYMYPDQNLGQDPPAAAAEYDGWEASITDKQQVVETLEQSMEYVRSLVEGMSEADLNRSTTLYGRQVGQWAVLFQLVAHMNEHLGQAIAYARMNGVVPPWSR